MNDTISYEACTKIRDGHKHNDLCARARQSLRKSVKVKRSTTDNLLLEMRAFYCLLHFYVQYMAVSQYGFVCAILAVSVASLFDFYEFV